MHKIHCRARMRLRRKRLTSFEHHHAAQQLIEKCIRLPQWSPSKHLGLYWPIASELDTRPLIATAWETQKYVYLPCVKTGDKTLFFKRYTPHTPLKTSPLNTMEPDTATPPFPFEKLDLIGLPLLAYTPHKFRLGMGAGYYDRLLAHRPIERPYCVGLAFHFQCLPTLPLDPWDQPLDAIISVATG